MKPIRFFALFLICTSFFSVSAETIWTNNIRLYSENKAYYANLAKSSDNIMDLSVCIEKTSLEVWSSWLDWGKDYFGYLSNDGSVFIAVNSVYSEYHNLITVYTQTKQESYTVKSISMNREFLKLVNGKYLWVNSDDKINRSKFLYDASGAAASFELELNDRRVISIKI